MNVSVAFGGGVKGEARDEKTKTNNGTEQFKESTFGWAGQPRVTKEITKAF